MCRSAQLMSLCFRGSKVLILDDCAHTIPNQICSFLQPTQCHWMCTYMRHNRANCARIYKTYLLIKIAICFIIEVSQLIKVDWLNEIRNTTLGKLTLGSGFLWSDLVSYTLGGLVGFVLEKYFLKKL